MDILLLSFLHLLPQVSYLSSKSDDLFLLLSLYFLKRFNIHPLFLPSLSTDIFILLLDPFLIPPKLMTLIIDGCKLLGVVSSSVCAGRFLWSHLLLV